MGRKEICTEANAEAVQKTGCTSYGHSFVLAMREAENHLSSGVQGQPGLQRNVVEKPEKLVLWGILETAQ